MHLLYPFCWGVKNLAIREAALRNFMFEIGNCALVMEAETILSFHGESSPSNMRLSALAHKIGARAMRKFWCTLMALAVLTACATVENEPQTVEMAVTPAPAATPAAVPVADLAVDFFDTKSFDKTLSTGFRKDSPTVTVNFLTPATLNDIPERLGIWFNMVEKYDGTVEIQPEPTDQSRSLILGASSLIIGVLISTYKAFSNKKLYGPVQDYDATVFYDRANGALTRVVFTRKEPRS